MPSMTPGPSGLAAAISLASDLESTGSRYNVAHLAVRDSVELVSDSVNLKMKWYAKVLAHHPFLVLAAVAVFSAICLIVPFMTKKMPSFIDPTLGFETRGTVLSQRATAWQNLAEALRPSGALTGNPIELLHAPPDGGSLHSKLNITVSTLSPDDVAHQDAQIKTRRKKKKKKLEAAVIVQEGPPTGITIPSDPVYDWDQHKNWTFGVNVSEAQPDFGNSSEPWKSLRDELSEKKTLSEHNHEHLSKDGFFCGAPSPEYSHMVLSTTDGSDFLSLAALRSACGLEILLRKNPHFTTNCQTSKSDTCCHSWTLHNYIAVLHGHTTCLQIKEHDVEETRKLLIDCAQYYHKDKLPDDCQEDKYSPSSKCSTVPPHCIKDNAVYVIMHYLVDVGFLPPNNISQVFVKNSMLFLPMARSSAMMPYYNALDSGKLSFGNVKVSAMDLGLKTTLFDDCLVRDTWLISLGALVVFFCMWVYTESFLVTFMAIIAIGLSLGISYFVYTIVFDMQFFPFMNLLACVVAVGIGADDAFIFCKVWSCTKNEKNCSSQLQIVQETLNHALLSMLITSFTTAVAFFTSFVSSITAIRCFSIFAGMAVVANLVLMVTWLPASVIISERLTISNAKWLSLKSRLQAVRSHFESFSNVFDYSLEVAVVRLPAFWVFFLGLMAVFSTIVVLYYPGLRLPQSPDFQLFSKSHPFEQYDAIYRDEFWFERLEKHSLANYKLPLRFVWGIKPVDSGDYYNPYSKGKLHYDLSFDMADPDSQLWLKQFCHNVRNQSFYQSTSGPLLTNCYIETLESWMTRRCKDTVDNIDHSPCCEMSSLPYKRSVFKNCTMQAMASIYLTPHNLVEPGLAGPKFAKNSTHPKIRAVVVEYDSNYSYTMSYEHMNIFFNEVQSWMQEELKSAPSGMQHGWFVSELRFYDLQHTIAESTVSALLISMAMSVIVLFFVTLDSVVSLFAVLSVTCTIFVTMAILLLLGWELNVLESVAINTSIGLAVDFSLHYSVSYRLAPDNANREEAVKFTLHRMGGPTAMGALTTGIAGVFMLPSSVLAYNQIGIFLVIIMAVSWIYATFFLMPLLCIAGPRHGFGRLSYKSIFCCLQKRRSLGRSPSVLNRSNKSVFGNVLSESTLSASSTTYPLHTSASEGHELDAFTHSGRKLSQSRKRSESLHTSQPPQRATSDQSPSATSACTVILCDDADLSRQHM